MFVFVPAEDIPDNMLSEVLSTVTDPAAMVGPEVSTQQIEKVIVH